MGFNHRRFVLEDPKGPEKNDKDDNPPKLPCPNSCSQSNSIPLSSSKGKHFSSILILSISFLCLVFLLALTYFAIRRRRRSRRTPADPARADDRNPGEDLLIDELERVPAPVDHHVWHIRTVGLPGSVIDSIAVFKYKKGENSIVGNDCAVCLTEFNEDETLRLLPKCTHAFHVACIDTWLRSHTNCPVCRAPIVKRDERVGDGIGDVGSPGEEENQTEEGRFESEGGNFGGPIVGVDKLAQIVSTGCRVGSGSIRSGKFARVVSDLGGRDMAIVGPRYVHGLRRSVSVHFSPI